MPRSCNSTDRNMDIQKIQEVLGYARWENFAVAIGRAMESCKTLGISIDDHFRDLTKMVQLGSGSQRA